MVGLNGMKFIERVEPLQPTFLFMSQVQKRILPQIIENWKPNISTNEE